MTPTGRSRLQRSRREILAGAVATGTTLAFAAKAPAVLAQPAPLRIGIVNTFTGINALAADTNLKGMSLYFDSIGWTVAGRKIELIKEDDQFNPQIGLQKVRKLVESDHVDLICGPQASNVAIAVHRITAATSKTAAVMLVWAGTDSITWERIPFLFRPGLSSWQVATPMAGWIADNVAKEVVLAGADFAAGHDVMRTFKAAYGPKGGKVLKEIYPPLGTGDYSAYLTDILSIAPPAVFAFFTGTDAVRFVQQFAELGLRRKGTARRSSRRSRTGPPSRRRATPPSGSPRRRFTSRRSTTPRTRRSSPPTARATRPSPTPTRSTASTRRTSSRARSRRRTATPRTRNGWPARFRRLPSPRRADPCVSTP